MASSRSARPQHRRISGASDGEESNDGEELEYAVQFARNVPATTTDDDADGAMMTGALDVSTKEKEPVVFVIGWAGCLDRHLGKYSEMYVSGGVTAIQFKPQFRQFFLTPSDIVHVRQQAAKFLELASDLDLDDHCIFFHVFSNNGLAFYSEVVDLVLRSQQAATSNQSNSSYGKLKICGAILDSCPSLPRVTTLVRYKMVESKLNNWTPFQTALRILYSLFFAVLSPLTKYFLGWDYVISMANRQRVEHWPLYYIYSEADALIPFTDVEDSIRHRSVNGLPVGSHRFTDSVHVAHFRKYPEEYSKHCLTFINNCLNQ